MMRRLSAHALLRWTARAFGRAAADRVFEPLLADWQRDAAEAPSAFARAVAHVGGALAFATSGMLVVARGPRRAIPHAARAAGGVVAAAFLFGLVQGFRHGYKGAPDTAALIAASCALSVLPAFAVAITRRQRRYARAWRLLLLVTLFALLAQGVLLVHAWPSILAARPTATPVPWVWRLQILATGVLPGLLGVTMARTCSRRTSAPEFFGFLWLFPLLAWSDLFSPYAAPVPVMSAVLAIIITVWTRNVINEEHTRRAQHQTRVSRYRRLAARH
jgi:hypothetical protein